MTKNVFSFSLFLLTFFMSVLSCHAYSATIVDVRAGDLLVISAEGQAQTVRLYGVMCPVHGQPYHDKARLLVNHLTLQRNAEITPLFNDEEGVSNVLVRIQGVKDYLNGQLVGYGMAWVKPVQCKSRLCDEWRKLEELARKNLVGLWSEPYAVPPWEWRKAQRMEIYRRSQESPKKE
jgi:endonuclease YncB( thermonuclease family)